MATKRTTIQPKLAPQPELDLDFATLNRQYLADKEYRLLMMVQPKPTQPTKTRKAPTQAKIPVVVDDRRYASICAMMKGEGIPDQAKMGLDNNWSQIRNSLKKSGVCEWKFSDKRTITITQ
jgi:hypothetical protein